jgi:hypothetical protein
MFFIKIGVAETDTVKSSNSKVSALIGELCGLNLVIIILDAVEQFGFGDDESTKRAVGVSEAGLSCAPRVQRQLSQSMGCVPQCTSGLWLLVSHCHMRSSYLRSLSRMDNHPRVPRKAPLYEQFVTRSHCRCVF